MLPFLGDEWYAWDGNSLKNFTLSYSISHKSGSRKFPTLDEISTFDMKTVCESVRKRLRKPQKMKIYAGFATFFRSLRFISMSVEIFLYMLFQSTSNSATKLSRMKMYTLKECLNLYCVYVVSRKYD